MPVSCTWNRSIASSAAADQALITTSPLSVNFTAFEARLRRI